MHYDACCRQLKFDSSHLRAVCSTAEQVDESLSLKLRLERQQ